MIYFSFQRATSHSLSLSLSLSMAENYSLGLVGVMDRLWFHQIILFSEPINSLLCSKALKTPKPISEPLEYSSSNLSQSLLSDEEISLDSSAITILQDDSKNKDKEKERPTRSNLITKKSHSSSSSPSTQKSSKNLRYSGAARRLQKTMSCKSLLELELEEVKGFMDLGFIFKKEQLSPQMMSVVPGLQRLGGLKNERKTELIDAAEVAKDDETEEEEEEEKDDDEEKRGVMRPYLSEAWLIKRPDSPLLHLRVPRVSATADMKKHLRFWARTVASVIQQES